MLVSVSLLITLADIAAALSALLAAWLWFKASVRQVRRVSYHETHDAADNNRLDTAMNRAQILNSRAAMATGVSALIVAFT